MGDRFLVFVSSVSGESLQEREVVEEAVGAIPLARPWLFEHTPASGQSLAESDLRKVRECDVFILLMGKDIVDPVRQEYQTAVQCHRPRLVFLKDVERSPQAQAFVEKIDVNPRTFASDEDLHRVVKQELVHEIVREYRTWDLRFDEVPEILTSSLGPRDSAASLRQRSARARPRERACKLGLAPAGPEEADQLNALTSHCALFVPVIQSRQVRRRPVADLRTLRKDGILRWNYPKEVLLPSARSGTLIVEDDVEQMVCSFRISQLYFS